MDYVQLPEPSLLQHQVPLVYIFTAAEVCGLAMLLVITITVLLVLAFSPPE